MNPANKKNLKQAISYFLLRALRKIRKIFFPKMPIPIFLREGGIILYDEGQIHEEYLYLSPAADLPHDFWERNFVNRFLKNGMIFFDIGAHAGLYTIIGAKRVGRGLVYAFEPAPREFLKLQRNIRINRLKNVICEQLAIGNISGKMPFYEPPLSFGPFGSLKPPVIPVETKKIYVSEITIDDYVSKKKIAQLDLMKIDVEGGELDVFKGADKTLKILRPTVLSEINDKRTKPFGYEARELISWLGDRNYDWFEFDSINGKLLPHKEKKYYEYCNLVAVPREKLDNFFSSNILS